MSSDSIWTNFTKGDRTAFEQIYRAHIDALINYGSKFSLSQELVEDAVQDLFIQIWKDKEKLAHVKTPVFYLMVSLRRKIIHQKKKTLQSETEHELDESFFDAEISIDEKILSKEFKKEQIQKMNQAMKRLSSRQKEAIFLKFYSDMNYKEIAEAMDINYQSVRNLIFNAIKKMKSSITILLFFLFHFLKN